MQLLDSPQVPTSAASVSTLPFCLIAPSAGDQTLGFPPSFIDRVEPLKICNFRDCCQKYMQKQPVMIGIRSLKSESKGRAANSSV